MNEINTELLKKEKEELLKEFQSNKNHLAYLNEQIEIAKQNLSYIKGQIDYIDKMLNDGKDDSSKG